MRTYVGVLTDAQRQVLSSLETVFRSQRFYLAGGSALALQLGHRRSVDFDIFSRTRITRPEQLANWLRREGVAFRLTETEEGALHGIVESVRVTFMDYTRPLEHLPVSLPELAIRVASLDDLATMKMAAIAARREKRDYVDLHVLASLHRPLEELVGKYVQHRPRARASQVLARLTSFEEIDGDPMPEVLSNLSWDQVKSDLVTWVEFIRQSRANTNLPPGRT